MPISNNVIELAERYLPILDEIYKREALTTDLDQTVVRFINAKTVQIFMINMNGLANYDRNGGFTQGNVNASWQPYELKQDRGTTFMIDSMDNDETINMTFANTVGQFLRNKVVPELDAYRFAKYADKAGSKDTGDLTSSNIVGKIDGAIAEMDEKEVPSEGRILYITPTKYTLLKQIAGITRFATMTDRQLNRDFEVFDSMRVRKIPQRRFYTDIEIKDIPEGATGTDDGGFDNAGEAINFMIIHPSATFQVNKHAVLRIYTPRENLFADAWKIDYRIYHDAFAYLNKTNGIYMHSEEP